LIMESSREYGSFADSDLDARCSLGNVKKWSNFRRFDL